MVPNMLTRFRFVPFGSVADVAVVQLFGLLHQSVAFHLEDGGRRLVAPFGVVKAQWRRGRQPPKVDGVPYPVCADTNHVRDAVAS